MAHYDKTRNLLIRFILNLMFTELIDRKYRFGRSKYDGLCSVVQMLESQKIVTTHDEQLIIQYLYANKPFTSHFRKLYFWKPYEIEPRRKWLEKHIKRLSK